MDQDKNGALDTRIGILSQGTAEHSGTMVGILPVRQWVHYVATMTEAPLLEATVILQAELMGANCLCQMRILLCLEVSQLYRESQCPDSKRVSLQASILTS